MRPLALALIVTSAVTAVCAGQTLPPVDSSAMQVNDAYVTAAEGRVSIDRDKRTWALSSGERVPIQRMI
ncbi:MAG: hypothetical protein JO061_10085, partial [Acidobacteriaceae bacterium]|nr:hypothetical protein [Acidobacteriaceae bacterium]